jgi:hypothetical protein
LRFDLADGGSPRVRTHPAKKANGPARSKTRPFKSKKR